MSHDSHADRFTAGPHFDYDPRTRVVFGPGRLSRLGKVAKELGCDRVLVCTDAGIRAAGHAERGIESLRAAGLHVTVFDEIHPNPTTDDVERGVTIARDARADLLVGLGGGSSMDTAKGVNFVLTNGGRLADYQGFGKATKPMLPMIAVPTTAGTGSEAQSFAVIGDATTHVKMACGDRKAAFKIAILDPELTVSMPRAVTAATGIDALSHAAETYVTRPRNDVAQLFGRRAWSLLAENLPTVIDEPNNVEARGAMLLGAHFAGAAIENSMLGATHALANPLTARYDTTHGLAVGIMLPHVIRFNASTVGELYADLADDLDLCDRGDPEAPFKLADFVSGLVRKAGGPTTLTECGVDPATLSDLAELAAKQWTGNFNPRPVDEASLEELYRCAM
ncbi:MAG: iron-containing alcohol dehydrogenase [Planctomycetota bacterium]|nr:iron-containing alcohol dehydrogenase [Planctomycetaceae bacterium]MDQ3330956.1 iron-containing alcohol dehydrogenase [Planctomycetota bacterium]